MSPALKKGIKRFLLAVTAVLALTVAGAGGFYAYVEADGNLHVVDEGNLYRSRQLSGPELEHAIGTYGIRSILNLRGAHPGRDWYDAEMAVATEKNVAHYDYGISAVHRVSPAQLDEILAIIRVAPKPILVHCRAGADRTGLVSAAYLLTHGEPPDEAEGALTLRYGHFPWLGSRTRAMDESFEEYVGASAGAGE
jgi:protein tyrosine/serine phosphatase